MQSLSECGASRGGQGPGLRGRDGRPTGGLGSLPTLRDREGAEFPIWPRTPGKRLACFEVVGSHGKMPPPRHQEKSCKSSLGGRARALASSCRCLACEAIGRGGTEPRLERNVRWP